MTDCPENPWVARFVGLRDPDVIRRRVEIRPRCFAEAERDSPETASGKFLSRLEEVFYPSGQCVALLYELISVALGHCQSHYRDRRDFAVKINAADSPLPAFSFPMCLTGLAGIGKSHVLKALGRLMPSDLTVTTEDRTAFLLRSHKMLLMQTKDSISDTLIALTGQQNGTRLSIGIARKIAYRIGWAVLIADEFQWVTQSDRANARLVQLLMQIAYVGVPVVYGANYSMLHKLLRRNHEDRQRLLGNVWELFPERPDSEDWITLLQWHKDIAPDVFEFDPRRDAEAIHQLTGGISRAENKLLVIAFRRAMESGYAVGLPELERAYMSGTYSSYRRDLEILSKLPYSPALQKRHKDLWCPLDTAQPIFSGADLLKRRQERVAEAATEASLNARERTALKAMTPGKSKERRQRKASVIPIASKKSLSEQLKDDAAWYEGNV